jgi:phenylalanyl-tRNA synthetase beta chain
VDPHLCWIAMDRLSGLITEFCGGKPGPVIDACEAGSMPIRAPIRLRPEKVNQVLGVQIPEKRISEIFEQLGFIIHASIDVLEVQAPPFRFDINIEADLIEELARIHGYDRIEGDLPMIRVKLPQIDEARRRIEVMSRALVALGYREIISYAFVDPDLQNLICSHDGSIPLLNPLSTDMSVMRRSLLPGLIQVLIYNVKRQQPRVRLFEVGHIFENHDKFTEKPLIAGLIYGNIYPEQWDREDRLSDFYDIKADLESILRPFVNMNKLQFTPSQHGALHPSQAAQISCENHKIGILGRLHPELQAKFDLPNPVCMFELDLSLIPSIKQIKYRKLSKFPSIRRDISIIVNESIPAMEIINVIHHAEANILSNLELFDVYQGEGIDLGKKSLALGLTFQRSSSTLMDEEADAVLSSILDMLYKQFGAILRE